MTTDHAAREVDHPWRDFRENVQKGLAVLLLDVVMVVVAVFAWSGVEYAIKMAEELTPKIGDKWFFGFARNFGQIALACYFVLLLAKDILVWTRDVRRAWLRMGDGPWGGPKTATVMDTPPTT